MNPEYWAAEAKRWRREAEYWGEVEKTARRVVWFLSALFVFMVAAIISAAVS